MSKIIEGRDLMFFVCDSQTGTYKSIAAATNCSIEISLDTKEVTTKDSASGAWQSVTPNKLSWSGSSDNLFEMSTAADGASFDVLFDYMTGKKTVFVKFGTGTGFAEETGWTLSKGMYEGTAVITSLNLTAGADDNATYTVSFTGSGALKKVSA